ncbi:hypothetical protein EVAR_18957_1 [Eumeta japonica]|uniref:Uncharacterized protein n=1 Tax=Eumeta variegata TaxID=151549 RepID=A0A4C1WVX0_EUMVA|nr:hypothetical protein EVAR_18957_1 [Eumeta japonica]
MPNVGGPKQSRRRLLSSVVTAILTYGKSIWADALEIQVAWRKAGPVYRLRVIEDAEHAFFECSRFSQKREKLKMVLNQNIQPETIVDAMLTSELPGNFRERHQHICSGSPHRLAFGRKKKSE